MGIIAFNTRWAGSPPEETALRKLVEWSPGGFVVHERVRQSDLEHLLSFLPRRSVAAIALFAPLPKTVVYAPSDTGGFPSGTA